MKKTYTSPRVTQFGTVEALTQYGTGLGSFDTVYLANPAGANAVAFVQANNPGFTVLQAQNQVALQILLAGGAPDQATALANIQGGATGIGGSYSPTLGATFTP